MVAKRLIKVTFPLKQISLDAVHEKNVGHEHVSTLQISPARRPRAALIATLLADSGSAAPKGDTRTDGGIPLHRKPSWIRRRD